MTRYNSMEGGTTKEARFEAIFLATKGRLYNFVKKHIKGHDAIEDIVQQCYIRLWEKLDDCYDDENILPLLSTYASRAIIDAIRKEARMLLREKLFSEQLGSGSRADEGLYVKELQDQLQHAVNALPPQKRTIYTLRRELGLSHKEISAQLQISHHTVERHMNEALRLLRKQFKTEHLILLALLAEICSR
jgi:RNA polymerase sigma-70 factor (ECF subfamily)